MLVFEILTTQNIFFLYTKVIVPKNHMKLKACKAFFIQLLKKIEVICYSKLQTCALNNHLTNYL